MSSSKGKSTKNQKPNKNQPVSKRQYSPFQELSDDIITPEVAEVIKDLPEDKRNTVVRALMISKSHAGPLPDGETIKIYSEVIPDGGNRLMATVEKQLDHRIEIEKEGVKKSFEQSGRGQIFGFTIAIVFGIIAWDLAKSGHEVTASILGSIDLVALVTIFITGRNRK